MFHKTQSFLSLMGINTGAVPNLTSPFYNVLYGGTGKTSKYTARTVVGLYTRLLTNFSTLLSMVNSPSSLTPAHAGSAQVVSLSKALTNLKLAKFPSQWPKLSPPPVPSH
jgi:hypothetical protein